MTRSTVAVLAITFVLATSAEGAATNLALVPGKTVPMAWNLLTASWLETNPAALLLACVAAVVLGRVVEPAVGGGREFIRFLVFVTGFVGLAAFVASLLRFYATRDERSLYEPHHGFQGVLAGLLVAVKQHVGENPVNVRGLRWCKCKTLPHAHLAACALAASPRDACSTPSVSRSSDSTARGSTCDTSTQTGRIRRRRSGRSRLLRVVFPAGGGGGARSVADAAHACCCGGRERRLANAYGTGSLHPGLGHLGVAGRVGAVKGGAGSPPRMRRRRNGDGNEARARSRSDSRRSRGKRRRLRRGEKRGGGESRRGVVEDAV